MSGGCGEQFFGELCKTALRAQDRGRFFVALKGSGRGSAAFGPDARLARWQKCGD
jgi:hypothetical protein